MFFLLNFFIFIVVNIMYKNCLFFIWLNLALFKKKYFFVYKFF